MAVDAQDPADVWFRRRGLPMVVHRRRRGRKLLERSIPIQLYLVVVSLLAYWLQSLPTDDAPERPDASGQTPVVDTPPTDVEVLLVSASAVVMLLIVPALLAWLGAKVVRTRSDRLQLTVAVILTVLTIVLLPVWFAADGKVTIYALLTVSDDPAWYVVGDVAQSFALILGVLGLIWLGVGSILLWAIRRALSQIGRIGTMASRVLPLLLLVVMFTFLTNELWQVTNRLTRAEMWMVVGFLALIAIAFIAATFSDELPALRATSRTSPEVRARVEDTPLAGAPAVEAAPRLSWPERINVVLVLFVAQAVQIVIFSVLVFAFFLVFGTLVLSPEAEAEFLAGQVLTPGKLFGFNVGFSNAMLQVSLFLAAFSGLSFTASTTAEEPYRRSFFDPLLEDVAFSLAARDAYRARWRRTPAPVA